MFHFNTVSGDYINKNETLLIIRIACQRNEYHNYHMIEENIFQTLAQHGVVCYGSSLS